ncbi:MAG: glycosyltransferase family 2 protein [Patescibacteria group bacterium]|jgi:cellulose synthase/poly-beta-1,6-N-acetylglucosamine synthase-like glycosyltransferase
MLKFFLVLKSKFFANPNRVWEILPGSITWLTFILAIVFSIWLPIWAIYFIIVFDLFWLLKVFYLVINQVTSWFIFKKQVKINWLEKLKGVTAKNWQDYYHVIFLPTYKEPFEVIERTFISLAKAVYEPQKFIVVLAGEERDQENFLSFADKIIEKYSGLFLKILVTVHPKDLPGEIQGKASNINYAGHKVQEIIDQLNIPYENVIVSSFDIDTCPHPQYFSYLAYKYLTHPKPTRVSYQPIAIYHNNIWQSDPLTRVVANSTTFWLMTDLARSDRLFTFSSHSMSFRALVDVGFWEKDIVSEDSRIFLQCLLKYDGDYQVEPMYIPVSMNTVSTGKFWKAMSDQYKQMRRWAWGVEHIPYMMKRFKDHPKMPFKLKFKHFFNQMEGMWSWATAPILITVMGRLPLLMAPKGIQSTAIAQMAPLILEKIMTFALVGLALNAILSTILMPERPKGNKWYTKLVMLLEWVLFPVTMIVFGSIPATEAQTRLMLGGKYRLGFWVTEKK